MKPYNKNTMKGFEPFVEIYYNKKKKAFMLHNTNCSTEELYRKLLSFFLGYIERVITNNEPEVYDTASPECRKELNKKR